MKKDKQKKQNPLELKLLKLRLLTAPDLEHVVGGMTGCQTRTCANSTE